MNWIIFWTAYLGISIFNFVFEAVRRYKTKNKAKKMFEENGYIVNKYYFNMIFNYLTNEVKDRKDAFFALNFVPLINCITLFKNIFYIFDHRFEPEFDALIKLESYDSLVLEDLIKRGAIKKNPNYELIEQEKRKLEDLEKKYDELSIQEEKIQKEVIIVTEDDKTEELLEKIDRIRELIERKNKESDIDNSLQKVKVNKK